MSARSFSSWLQETEEVRVRAFMQGDGKVHLDPDCKFAEGVLVRAGSIWVPARAICLYCVMAKIQEDPYWPPAEIVHAPKPEVLYLS